MTFYQRFCINNMTIKCFLAFLVLCSAGSLAAKLPSGWKRCDRKQEDFSDCVTEAVRGIAELMKDPNPQVGLPRLDPLDIPAMTIGSSGGTVSVQQNYKNVKVTGFSDVTVDHVEFDFENKVLKMYGLFHKIIMKADYDINGKVLLLPIQGTGPSTFTMEKVPSELIFDFKIIEKNGKKYIKITGNHMHLNPTFVSYDFVNLFNGDKQLGDNINKVLNENWKEVYADASEGLEKAYGFIFQGLAEAFFSRVPIRDIFLNETEL